MSESIEILHASTEHLGEIVPLFDAYRCWYGEENNLDGARRFLSQRMMAAESEIFFVRMNDQPAAFAQLYPAFSSVAMESIWILNDLYVIDSARGQGIGTLLLETAVEFARALGAVRLELAAGVNNRMAQSVCEAHGWVKDTEFLRYSLSVTDEINEPGA